MNSRIWRTAGVAVLCLGISAQALAEGPNFDNGGPRQSGQGNGGQRGQERGPGNGNQGQERPQGNAQRAQEQQRQRVNEQRQQQDQMRQEMRGRQDQMRQQQQDRQAQIREGRNRADWQNGGQQQGQHSLPIQPKPDEVRQTQPPIHGNYPDLRPQRGGDRQWQAGAPGRGPNHGPDRGPDRWPGSGHGNGWGPGPQYRPGHMIDRFPGNNYRVPYRGQDFFFSDGYWYRPQGPRYVVVAPPYGIRTRYLPDYATRMWIGGGLFFLAAGTYYQWVDNAQEYVVVTPPPQPVAVQPPPQGVNYDVAFYPANGQSPSQVERDRYECQRWAAQQSGFDPAVATYAPADAVLYQYRQVMGNCLASRGYSVN